MFENILALYGINAQNHQVKAFGDGLINHTWKVNGPENNYILQRVNSDVFKKPEDIDENLVLLKQYLGALHPDYLFVSPLPTLTGKSLVHESSGYFRLFPFIEGSSSLTALSNNEEAYEAAKQFGKFSRLLNDFDAQKLNITIPDFHNLTLRYEQFESACRNANPERLAQSQNSIDFIIQHRDLVDTYKEIVADPKIPLRVIHHDTKISNVLFDAHHKGLCVIDLDTVMPGYFISDIGDMMRTYLSEVSEEETDFSKINVRQDFFRAIHDGYMEEMEQVLTPAEKQYFTYAGKFIIYMQAIRFLADYLLNDPYYGAKYPEHNFNRANNQIALLKAYFEAEQELSAF